jgi:hypothetical protein
MRCKSGCGRKVSKNAGEGVRHCWSCLDKQRERMVDRGVYKPKRRLRAKDMARSRRGWR